MSEPPRSRAPRDTSQRLLASDRAAFAMVTDLAQWSAKRGITVTIGLMMIITLAEVYAPSTVVVALLYLVPIGLASLGRGWKVGAMVSLACCVLGIGSDVLHNDVEPVASIIAWNWSLRAIVFVASAWVTGALRSRLRLEADFARTDALTGLSNRFSFFEAVTLELARSARTGRPVSLAYIDLDRFKKVNDERGHEEGDRVLIVVAATLRLILRNIDMAARLGGDEFAILMPESDAEGSAHAIARLREEWLRVASRADWPVRFSIGVVTLTKGHALNAEQVIAASDALMYECKNAGRDSVRFATL